MDQHLTASRALACALALWCTPAWAQEEEASDEPEHLHLPGYEPSTRNSSITLEIAPELVSHNPLGSDSQTTNALDLSLVFATQHPLSDTLEAEFNLGASKTIDNGSFSELAAAVELRTRPDASGLSAFAGYDIAREYTDFFDERGATTHEVIAGLRYGREIGVTEIGLQFAPRINESSGTANDHLAVDLSGEVVLPMAGDRILLILDASLERRWYEHPDPVLFVERRDWRFASYLGFDFAGLFDTGERWVHDLAIGVEWLKVSSNDPFVERSDLAVLPAFSIGVAF